MTNRRTNAAASTAAAAAASARRPRYIRARSIVLTANRDRHAPSALMTVLRRAPFFRPPRRNFVGAKKNRALAGPASSSPAWGRQRITFQRGRNCQPAIANLGGSRSIADPTAGPYYAKRFHVAQRGDWHASHALPARSSGQVIRRLQPLGVSSRRQKRGASCSEHNRKVEAGFRKRSCSNDVRVRLSTAPANAARATFQNQKFQRCALATRKSRNACTRATVLSSSG
jgi:hypothetical protein